MTNKPDLSGYHDCPCRDCFETAIGTESDGSASLCHECADAGCDADGDSECSCEEWIPDAPEHETAPLPPVRGALRPYK